MPSPREDPIVTHARREAVGVFLIWLAALIYSVTYCYLYGYGRRPEELRLVLGMPDWVLWGVFAPWLVCWAISLVFSRYVMRDADLGQDAPDEEGPPDA